MRKIIFSLYFMIVSGIASAAQQCVDFGELSTGLYIASSDVVDWTVYNSDVTVQGIGVCVQTIGNMGDVKDTLKYDASLYCAFCNDDDFYRSNSNQYCWCRMFSPVASKWVAYGSFGDAEECLDNCSEECAAALITSTAFRSAMLGSFGG